MLRTAGTAFPNKIDLKGNKMMNDQKNYELSIQNRAFSNPKIDIQKTRNSIDLNFNESNTYENLHNKSIFISQINNLHGNSMIEAN